jgi:cysteine-rich repeat protein
VPRWSLIWLVCATACLRTDTTTCANGLTCPADTQCAEVDGTTQCVRDDQASVCKGRDDGALCDFSTRRGICRQQYCLPGCGDETQDELEECDDGNFKSHDGCASNCTSERPTWTPWSSGWVGRSGHATVYDAARARLMVLGGVTADDQAARTWTHVDAANLWEPLPSAIPDARRYAAVAYDTNRDVVVVFGGRDLTNVVLGDTWEYDGTQWKSLSPPNPPAARYGAGMAYDPVNQRVVMFGGFDLSPRQYNDTWTWNGTTWTKLTPANKPGARQYHAMAWDAANQRIVITGGTGCNTWVFAAGDWTKLTGTEPSCRWFPAAAFVPGRNKVVLFGGYLDTDEYAETWELDVNGWTEVNVGVTPPARWAHTLTYDPSLAAAVLVGGASGADLLDDVWAYDGTWTQLDTGLAPAARSSPVIYDSGRDELVLVSGEAFTPSKFGNGTWTFDGVSWTRASTTGPVERSFHSLAYDSKRDRVVLFGGVDSTRNAADETWEWSGSSWLQIQPSASPPPRLNAAMAFDSVAGVTVLFGGYSGNTFALGTPYEDTWEYDGSTWKATATGAALHPPAQGYHAMAFDPDRGRIVLFDVNGDTWTYADQQWTHVETVHTPGPRTHASLNYDPWRKRMVLYGGESSTFYYTDLWDLVGDDWEPRTIFSTSPPVRQGIYMAPLPQQRELVLFGGRRQASGYFDDTWQLRYEGEGLSEDCTNLSDDDGDLQIDAVDPDCGPAL